MILRALIAVLLISLSHAVRADWQYAKWGATPEEVITASQGMASNSDPEIARLKGSAEDTASVIADYRSGDYEFDVFFRFGNARNDLRFVTMELKNQSKCHQLRGSLSSKYGEGESKAGVDVVSWYDRKENNRVSYIGAMFGMKCSVTYQGLVTSETEGL